LNKHQIHPQLCSVKLFLFKISFMRTIIAAIDFSPASKNAADYAARLALDVHAELLLINIVQVPVTVKEIPVSATVLDEMFDDSEKELSRLKDELTNEVGDKITIRMQTPVGPVSHLLREAAREEKAFAIVIGPDAVTGIGHLFNEDHALAAINRISIPVLIVPEQTRYKTITKIVLAADLAEPDRTKPLRVLKEWLKIFKPQLDIVNVTQNAQFKPESLGSSIVLQNELEHFHPKLHFIYENKIKKGIDDYIEQHHPDLLVTIPGAYGFFSGLFHQSKSKQLIRHPSIPVLSIHS
jgi:nucleotide-binding universal stress UspA family protein